MPQRVSRAAWPQIKTTGCVMGVGGGRADAAEGLRVKAAFWVGEREACMGCRVCAFRYAVARARNEGVVCGIASIRRKLGKRYAVVVSGISDFGSELAVIKMLVNGYSPRTCQHTFFLLKTFFFRTEGVQTSNASPPFPITPFSPLINVAVEPLSSSKLLAQSDLPVQSRTCSA